MTVICTCWIHYLNFLPRKIALDLNCQHPPRTAGWTLPQLDIVPDCASPVSKRGSDRCLGLELNMSLTLEKENYRPNLRENMSIVFCIPPKGLKWIEILWEISLPTLDLAIPTPKKIDESSRISPVETKLIGVDIIISLNWVVGIPNRYYIIKSKLIIKTNQRLYIYIYHSTLILRCHHRLPVLFEQPSFCVSHP